MDKWEYQVVYPYSKYELYRDPEVGGIPLETFLNQQGAQGWELVSYAMGSNVHSDTSPYTGTPTGLIKTNFFTCLILKRLRS